MYHNKIMNEKIELSEEKLEFPSTGGSECITVTSNCEFVATKKIMSKKKNIDDRSRFLIRYRISETGKVNFIDPCCDEIPAVLFGELMKSFSMIEQRWNASIDPITHSENILSTFFNGMSDMIASGIFRAGEYYSVDTLGSIPLLMPKHIPQTNSFTPEKQILFLRLPPVYYQLNKRSYMQGIALSVVENTLCSHPSFIGHVKVRRFKYREDDLPEIQKTVYCSCIALDYALFKSAFGPNIDF